MMASLIRDVLFLIFAELHDLDSLHSCSLVNKTWSQAAIPSLWKYFSDAYENTYNYKLESREKFYNIIAHFLPNNPGDPLPQNDIILPLNKFPKGPMFEYMNFFTRLSTLWIEDMVEITINDEVGSKYKKRILEYEIYKLIFNRCNNVKYFCYYSKKRLYRYPNAKKFFSNLLSLEICTKDVTSKTLMKFEKICKNLSNLKICKCDKDIPGLTSFIKIQNNLQSLCLNFDDNEIKEEYTLLSNVIKKKAATLKKLTIHPIITLISPMFIPLLKNIQYLSLRNVYDDESCESVKWREWEFYLSMASFPHLQCLETLKLPSNIIFLIIKKSSKNILEINMHSRYENKELIDVISSYCPKLIRLTMYIDHKNLSEISIIFSNCTQLETISLTTNIIILPGDELLRVTSKMSPARNFSLKGLESFFEDW